MLGVQNALCGEENATVVGFCFPPAQDDDKNSFQSHLKIEQRSIHHLTSQ